MSWRPNVSVTTRLSGSSTSTKHGRFFTQLPYLLNEWSSRVDNEKHVRFFTSLSHPAEFSSLTIPSPRAERGSPAQSKHEKVRHGTWNAPDSQLENSAFRRSVKGKSTKAYTSRVSYTNHHRKLHITLTSNFKSVHPPDLQKSLHKLYVQTLLSSDRYRWIIPGELIPSSRRKFNYINLKLKDFERNRIFGFGTLGRALKGRPLTVGRLSSWKIDGFNQVQWTHVTRSALCRAVAFLFMLWASLTSQYPLICSYSPSRAAYTCHFSESTKSNERTSRV